MLEHGRWHQLPNEIWDGIFWAVAQRRPKDLLSLSLTCKPFHLLVCSSSAAATSPWRPVLALLQRRTGMGGVGEAKLRRREETLLEGLQQFLLSEEASTYGLGWKDLVRFQVLAKPAFRHVFFLFFFLKHSGRVSFSSASSAPESLGEVGREALLKLTRDTLLTKQLLRSSSSPEHDIEDEQEAIPLCEGEEDYCCALPIRARFMKRWLDLCVLLLRDHVPPHVQQAKATFSWANRYNKQQLQQLTDLLCVMGDLTEDARLLATINYHQENYWEVLNWASLLKPFLSPTDKADNALRQCFEYSESTAKGFCVSPALAHAQLCNAFYVHAARVTANVHYFLHAGEHVLTNPPPEFLEPPPKDGQRWLSLHTTHEGLQCLIGRNWIGFWDDQNAIHRASFSTNGVPYSVVFQAITSLPLDKLELIPQEGEEAGLQEEPITNTVYSISGIGSDGRKGSFEWKGVLVVPPPCRRAWQSPSFFIRKFGWATCFGILDDHGDLVGRWDCGFYHWYGSFRMRLAKQLEDPGWIVQVERERRTRYYHLPTCSAGPFWDLENYKHHIVVPYAAAAKTRHRQKSKETEKERDG